MVAMVPWYSAVSARPCQVCIVQRVSLEISLDSTMYSNWILFASVIISMLGQTWFLYKELRQWSFWDPVDPRLGQKSLGPVPLSPLSSLSLCHFSHSRSFLSYCDAPGFWSSGRHMTPPAGFKVPGNIVNQKGNYLYRQESFPSHAWPPPATS